MVRNCIGQRERGRDLGGARAGGEPLHRRRVRARRADGRPPGHLRSDHGQRDSLVIYGHRRMGKTSIARNLLHFCRFGPDTGLAFLNLQAVDWSQGLADLCYAIAFELWKALPTELAEPLPVDFDEHPLAKLRGMLARLDRQRDEVVGPRLRELLIDQLVLVEDEDIAAPPSLAAAWAKPGSGV